MGQTTISKTYYIILPYKIVRKYFILYNHAGISLPHTYFLIFHTIIYVYYLTLSVIKKCWNSDYSFLHFVPEMGFSSFLKSLYWKKKQLNNQFSCVITIVQLYQLHKYIFCTKIQTENHFKLSPYIYIFHLKPNGQSISRFSSFIDSFLYLNVYG